MISAFIDKFGTVHNTNNEVFFISVVVALSSIGPLVLKMALFACKKCPFVTEKTVVKVNHSYMYVHTVVPHL